MASDKVNRGWVRFSAAAVALAAVGLALNLGRVPVATTGVSAQTPASPVEPGVTALGRVEPEKELIRLSPSPAAGTTRVSRISVREGDRVRKGQIVALLDTHDTRLAALHRAEAQVETGWSRLAQVQAGAKAGDLTAQKATIARLEAELQIARREHDRFAELEREGAISASFLDSKLLTVQSTTEQLNQARSALVALAEVRPTDVRQAQAEVQSAQAAVAQARADLDLAAVRSPIAGRVLKIYSWPGEVVGADGIAEIGKTEQMYVVAQVYESDVRKVRLGQQARIVSDALPGELRGAVDQIGLLIRKQDALDTDPAADVDARVVEVKVRVDPADSPRLAGLTNLEVRIAFAP